MKYDPLVLVNKMKKNIIMVLVVIVCILFISASLHKVLESKSRQSKGERYSEHLSQTVEDTFTSIDEVESANAKVSYNEAQDQFSIELSLITDEDISDDQIEMYKNALSKSYFKVKLTTNGVLR